MTQPKQTKRRFPPNSNWKRLSRWLNTSSLLLRLPAPLKLEPCQLHKWIRQYKSEVNGVTPDNPALTPEQREIQSLRARIKRLEMEKEILKQAAVDSI
jgi:transposase